MNAILDLMATRPSTATGQGITTRRLNLDGLEIRDSEKHVAMRDQLSRIVESLDYQTIVQALRMLRGDEEE